MNQKPSTTSSIGAALKHNDDSIGLPASTFQKQRQKNLWTIEVRLGLKEALLNIYIMEIKSGCAGERGREGKKTTK